ncbi:crotonase/enoyl-CoA hydratase family protein [Kordiimonas sp. SCSIO 12603]|uniref:crotonase/enoyl-CoA hydratase family protein n=1 Tax=Kordiimonas sp. SCSIO 12603 TaxID=2829596 RepID=UPI002104B9B0|nr:crotonase/enoyl-CoA hydratase family protein [Kordiimonas sp. SCSIO 12603]UTW60151.1 crotonase/enoyl-CoA hydratase family protein [Kordiimonas sp. SCSIO 12603]
MAETPVSTEIQDDILIVRINRAERRNAVDGETSEALYQAFKTFDGDEKLSVAVLTGEGGYFCAGADLKALSEGSKNPLQIEGDLGPMGASRLQLSKPVIAAIEGHAVAGGMELALWCDLRVMASDAVMGIFCRRFGVPLIDMGTIRLPRLIGQSRAMDLILTGRPVGADEAEHIGLVNRVAEPGKSLEAAIKLAQQIAAFPQACMRNDRLSVLEQWSLTEEEAMQNEFKRGLSVIDAGETVAGAKRFASGEGRHGKF